MRTSRVLVLVVSLGWLGCGDEPPTAPDATMTPAGWTCAAAAYGDGALCHCTCGAPDPDCSAGVVLNDCPLLGEVCVAGACTLCGNGDVDDGEQCEPGAGAVAQCGPLGYQPGEVPCNETCAWAYDRCLPLPTCGNGGLDAAELCDGDAFQAGQDCASLGFAEGALACTAACAIDSSGCWTCGNGTVEAAESCDDVGTADGDGCSSACATEAGWVCQGAPSTCAPRCGDGVIIGTETCDDGDAVGGDGCSSACRIEQDCGCTGEPSVCSCLRTELIETRSWQYHLEAASLVVGGDGAIHVAYTRGVNFTDPDTGNARRRVTAVHGRRVGTTWTWQDVDTWDQWQAYVPPEHVELAQDGGALHLYFERLDHPTGSAAFATWRDGLWQLGYDPSGRTRDAVRSGGQWHVLAPRQHSDTARYRFGAPGAWTLDEGIDTELWPTRLAVGADGEVVVASQLEGADSRSYDVVLHRRGEPGTWAPLYSHTTTAPRNRQLHPIWLRPIALPGGPIVVLDEGFDCAGARWLRAHRMPGASAPELITDLSALDGGCSASGHTYSELPKAATLDSEGRLHVLLALGRRGMLERIEDHRRDATGWRARSLALADVNLLDAKIDGNGVTHIVALMPGADSSVRLVYIQAGPSAWME
jgi:cysteine-rich repeat protein